MSDDKSDDTLARLDTSVAHSARLWNYLLGGKDNFAVDRAAADQVLAYLPAPGPDRRLLRRLGVARARAGHLLPVAPGR